MFIKRSIKFFIIVLVAFAFASVATAYAATNTVDKTLAGEGSNDISGYKVTGVSYTLDTNDPSNITRVAFNLDFPATLVKVSLFSGGSRTLCDHNGGNAWICDLTVTVPVASATKLTVLATNN